MKDKKYITTPIYYVNDVPHIGHAYTTIAADVLNRYYKKNGYDSFFLTGTDEHGAKIAEAAKKAGKKPQEFVDELVPQFEKAWDALNVEYDGFIRTTNPKHEKVVSEFIERLTKAGFVEKRKYEGLYCVGCEKYVTEDELVCGKCPDHDKEPILQSEENYFFLLSKLQEKLISAIEKGEFKIEPQTRENEILGKIKKGLEDVSISRQGVDWGILYPGDASQTIYVWVDALINYYSATKIFKGPEWPADIHLIGKDILWFHAVIWPAMLLAVGEPLPKEVFAHGFFTIGGRKMSKTLGNAIDPIALSKKFGADAVRYAILREFPFGEDGDISEEKIAKRYEKELANGIGNLVQRTISMINKYEVEVKQGEKDLFGDTISEKIEVLDFYEALKAIKKMVDVANEKIDEAQPWVLAKENRKDELRDLLNEIYSIIGSLADNIYPFIPDTASKIHDQLKTLAPEPLFPRLEEAK